MLRIIALIFVLAAAAPSGCTFTFSTGNNPPAPMKPLSPLESPEAAP